jgi:hypothetical protein
MCTRSDKISKKRTGYKVILKKDGKYYSSFTGQRIKVGDVPDPPKHAYRLSGYWSSDLDDQIFNKCGFYDSSFAGFTAAYIFKDAAIELLRNMKYISIDPDYIPVIVKITLAVAFVGEYRDNAVIAGTKITKLNEVKF